MATAAFNKFQIFAGDLARAKHDWTAAGHTYRFYLSNAAPSASADLVKADMAEISTGNGYAGAVDIQNDLTESAGTAAMTAVDATVTASGGPVGPFRYVSIYNDSEASDALVGWYDYGTAITLGDGESLIVNFDTAILTLS